MPGDDGDLLLGIDVGTTRTKAVLVDGAGSTRAQSGGPTPFVARDGGVEASVDGLVDGVGRVVASLGDDRRRVAAVGIAGVAESGAPFGGDGAPVGPVISWHDGRGEETVARLHERFGEPLALRIGQRLRTVSSVAKLGWLVDRGARPRRWLGVPELCLHRLTGAEATEFSLAARTGCYDVGARRWMDEVAGAIGVAVDVFPPVLPAATVMGRVTAEGSAWSGVGAGTPVTIAGHDHLAGAEALGGTDDDAFNSVGTAETVLRRAARLPDVAVALASRLAVTLRPGGEGWVVLASAARAGQVVESVAGALRRSPSELDALAEAAGGGDERVVAGVDLDAIVAAVRSGEAPPLPYVGLPAGGPDDAGAESAAMLWSALLSALAARTADAVDRQHHLLPPARRLVVFGGGSTSRPWLAAKARALPFPVVRSPLADAVARGAAVFAGVAAGWWAAPADAPLPPLESVTG